MTGKMLIHQWPAPGVTQDQPDTTVLMAGESKTIPVGEWHGFRALEPTICIEIYEAAPVEEDIIRRNVGGKA